MPPTGGPLTVPVADLGLHRWREPAMEHTMKRRGFLAIVAVAVTTVGFGAIAVASAEAATGAITGYGGKCVDVRYANNTNATPIQLWTCNGTGAQQWTVGSDGTIRALGKCMDVSGAGTANGTRVQIWDCN